MDRQITRQNHYVPIWYQKGFVLGPKTSLHLLDLNPPSTLLRDGRVITARAVTSRAPKSCFWSEDLYTTRFGSIINDEVERYLFGAIDNFGARAVRAFAGNDPVAIHELFPRFFEYLDAQKVRTPKGLDWIKSKYPNLTQLGLMVEMQGLRQMHCTMWYESVREIVSAEQSDVKFIVTDHPVTTYNAACSPSSWDCKYPDDPPIELKGSQTVFALDVNDCLILSNLEYAKNPSNVDLKAPRTNPRYSGQTIARTDAFIRTRKLNSHEVRAINRVLKARAHRYIAAGDKNWLEPEKVVVEPWDAIAKILLPPPDELWHFGGEIYIGYKDGRTHYQDAFGRTSGAHTYLKKKRPSGPLDRNGLCGCGSGRKFKKCCEGIPQQSRPSWSFYSIRERNLMFTRAVEDILGLNNDKTWTDVRRELGDDQVKRIHEAFESLWPRDTDIADLLPRPDERVFRALYLGVVDPRTIAVTVTSWLAYFDEIVVPNPFINAGNVKPEFSPTHSPSKYKVQTLKNVLLLMMLEPFIHAGLVHMVPDPTDFNDLRHVVWNMAEQRIGDMKMDEKDMERFQALSRDDLMRATRGLPPDALRGLIERTSPDLSPEQIEWAIGYMNKEQESDPFALLQHLPAGEDGAQLQTIKGFNLELALFLAQLMGATVYTDVGLHWQHLHAHTSAAAGSKMSSSWGPLMEDMKAIRFMLEDNSAAGFRLRLTGEFADARSTLRRIANLLAVQGDKPVPKRVIKELLGKLDGVKRHMRREWQTLNSTNSSGAPFQGHIDMSIPVGGFERNTVRRLLLTYGRAKQVRAMPMAIFVKVEPAG